MKNLGFTEGQNIAIEFRWAKNANELKEYADQFVAQNVDIIFATSSPETGAAMQATKTIPIVFATHADPVGTGHVASLARPGGNITGLSVLLSELAAKALEILKEVVPEARRFGVISDPTAPSHVTTMRTAEATAEKAGVTLHTSLVRAVEEFEDAFLKLAREMSKLSSSRRRRSPFDRDPSFWLSSPSNIDCRACSARGTTSRLAELMSYSPDHVDLSRRAASYMDKKF